MSDVAASPVVAEAPAKRARWGARSIASLLIFVLATILTPIALIGHWGHHTVIDADRYIETVGPLASTPEVQEALSLAVTNAIVDRVDTKTQVQSLLDNLFPNSSFTDALAAPLAAGVNSLIGNLVDRFVHSEQFQTLWIELNRGVQRGVVAVLEGRQDGAIRLQGDQIVLDMTTALQKVQQYLVDNGVSAVANVTIPEVNRQIVLVDAPQLAQIRFVYALTSPILAWFLFILAGLFLLSILLARRRPRTVVATGIVLVIAALLVRWVMAAVEQVFVDQLSTTVFASASHAFYSTLFVYLLDGIRATIVLGLVLIVAGWFAGTTSWALTLRGHVKRGLASIGRRMPGGVAGLGSALSGGARYVRWAIYAVVLLVLLITQNGSVEGLLWGAAIAAGLVALLEILINVPDEATTVEPPTTPAALP